MSKFPCHEKFTATVCDLLKQNGANGAIRHCFCYLEEHENITGECFMKSVLIRSYSGSHFPAFGLKTENYEPE